MSRMCSRVCSVSALSLVLVCAVAASVEDKRAEIAPAPFVLGSRYGRSSAPLRVMAPRNDRFFMGSRYGKRSDVSAPHSLDAHLLSRLEARDLICSFTGVAPLYRCAPSHVAQSFRHEPNNPRKNDEDAFFEDLDEE